MLNPLFLEIANGILVVGGIMLLIVIVRYHIWSPIATPRGKKVARAIATMVAGMVIFRGWVWLWRHQVNDGISASWMMDLPVPAVGLVVQMIGIFCMVRLLSNSHASPVVWLIIVAATVILTTAFAVM